MRSSFVGSLALVGAAVVSAQRPSNESICDYYTTALLKDNNATNQYALVSLVVNTAVIGNYTKPNVGVSVPGILAMGNVNGTAVNLAQYFDGSLDSSNRGGNTGVSVNFLDGGGAAPIEAGMPANSKSSNQYALLTHLYEYFGALLGCSEYGMSGYPSYAGHTSMYEVHKFMGLDQYEVGYFIEQVGLAAASFGVSKEDVDTVGGALTMLFDHKCGAATAVLPKAPEELQSICIEDSCPLAPNATCSAYAAVIDPKNATMSGSSGNSTGTSGGNSTTGGSSGSGGNSTSGGSSGTQTSGTASQPTSGAMESAGPAMGLLSLMIFGVATAWLL